MNTLEIYAKRDELARKILNVEDIHVLEKLKDAIDNVFSSEAKPYTMDELNSRIDDAESEEGGTPSSQVFADIEHKNPWLCK
jgi:hypothetical protein